MVTYKTTPQRRLAAMANKKKMASRMRCSVVVLGDSRAGKSALIRRFTEGKFTQVGR